MLGVTGTVVAAPDLICPKALKWQPTLPNKCLKLKVKVDTAPLEIKPITLRDSAVSSM
jgi:hypothetical protein